MRPALGCTTAVGLDLSFACCTGFDAIHMQEQPLALGYCSVDTGRVGAPGEHFGSKVSAAVPDLNSYRPGTEAALGLTQNPKQASLVFGQSISFLHYKSRARAGQGEQGRGRAERG